MPTSDPIQESTEPGQAELIDALVQTSFVTMAILNKVGAHHDLSLTQMRVLGLLQDRRLQMTALADYLGLDKSTMTGLVDRAEKRGLLERAPNPTDGRSVDVSLTEQGAGLAERVRADVARSLAPCTTTLTRAERLRLLTLLGRLLTRRPASDRLG